MTDPMFINVAFGLNFYLDKASLVGRLSWGAVGDELESPLSQRCTTELQRFACAKRGKWRNLAHDDSIDNFERGTRARSSVCVMWRVVGVDLESKQKPQVSSSFTASIR